MNAGQSSSRTTIPSGRGLQQAGGSLVGNGSLEFSDSLSVCGFHFFDVALEGDDGVDKEGDVGVADVSTSLRRLLDSFSGGCGILISFVPGIGDLVVDLGQPEDGALLRRQLHGVDDGGADRFLALIAVGFRPEVGHALDHEIDALASGNAAVLHGDRWQRLILRRGHLPCLHVALQLPRREEISQRAVIHRPLRIAC
jgi:hypothetical protein